MWHLTRSNSTCVRITSRVVSLLFEIREWEQCEESLLCPRELCERQRSPCPPEICLRAAPTPSGDSEAGGSGKYVLTHGCLTVRGGADLLIGLRVFAETYLEDIQIGFSSSAM
jgi:hypothetical protein